MTDITILTCKAYDVPDKGNVYVENIFEEYQLLKDALEAKGYAVQRTFWDNPNFDPTKTKAIVFRTIWDYFERFDEFWPWLESIKEQTVLINPFSLVKWNVDKHYLGDLEKRDIQIVPTEFVDKAKYESLKKVCDKRQWKNIVIKPAISGAAFHTYKIFEHEIDEKEGLFEKLVSERDMLVQEYQETITTLGEASLMVFNGKYTHAILKKAKKGDFRVQDDFGGSVHPYQASKEEIAFAEEVFKACNPVPAYGRVDIIWDNEGNHYLSELEIIEPELWVRNNPASAKDFAEGIISFL